MILKTSRLGMSVLMLHMNLSRKNIKRGLKRNYGSQEGRELLSSYDKVKKELEDQVASFITNDALDRPEQNETLHYNAKEYNMISSFLDFYLVELKKFLDEAKDKEKTSVKKLITEEDEEHYQILREMKREVDEVKENYA